MFRFVYFRAVSCWVVYCVFGVVLHRFGGVGFVCREVGCLRVLVLGGFLGFGGFWGFCAFPGFAFVFRVRGVLYLLVILSLGCGS